MTKKVLFFFYNRLNDPLIQSNIFLYINEITKSKDHLYQFIVVTFEDKTNPLLPEERKRFELEFLTRKILWQPLTWHPGNSLVVKAWDLLLAFFKILKFRLFGYKYAVSLGSIAGSFLFLITRIVPMRYFLYQYEPHSEYAVDSHIWHRESLQFKLLNWIEQLSVRHCRVISSGTDYMQQRLKNKGIFKPFYKITSVANDKIFVFSTEKRTAMRRDLKIGENEKLIIYPGKIGGLYANGMQLISLFRSLWGLNKDFRFLIITSSVEEIKKAMQNEESNFVNTIQIIQPVSFEQMPKYLSAADLGVVSVLPGASQKFRSNIKVGEYLCSGLPYIVCKGISEDDLVAQKNNVGVVVNDLNPDSINLAKNEIRKMLAVPKSEISQRCRVVGINYRGFDKQYSEFVKALNCLVTNQ